MLHLLYGAFVCFACVAHAAVGILPATVQQVGAAGVDLRQPEPPLFGRARASQVETHKQNESKTLWSEAPRQRLHVFTGLCDLFIYVNDPLVMSWNQLDQTSWNGFQCRNELVTPNIWMVVCRCAVERFSFFSWNNLQQGFSVSHPFCSNHLFF